MARLTKGNEHRGWDTQLVMWEAQMLEFSLQNGETPAGFDSIRKETKEKVKWVPLGHN